MPPNQATDPTASQRCDSMAINALAQQQFLIHRSFSVPHITTRAAHIHPGAHDARARWILCVALLDSDIWHECALGYIIFPRFAAKASKHVLHVRMAVHYL